MAPLLVVGLVGFAIGIAVGLVRNMVRSWSH